MEFRLDDGQIELQRTVARFCEDRFPLASIGDREGAPVDRSRWTELAGLGVFGLLLGQDAGGSGLGAVEAALAFEQLGSHLVPGPILWTVLGAPHLDRVVRGDVLVGGLAEAAVLDGAAPVEHAADIDILLVVGEGGIRAHRAADLAPPTPLHPLDPLTPLSRWTGLTGGEPLAGADAAAELLVLGTMLSAAFLTGIAARALEVARAYALEREQFGVPIGSFQAIKHLLADMYVRATLAQSATYAAAAVLEEPDGEDPTRSAAGAKLLAGEAAITNSSDAVQVLGGMGFTWDMLPNRLLKRAWVLEHGFGTAEDHALHLGTSLLVGGRDVTGSAAPDGIAVESDGGVLRITIDRPDRKGSLDPAAVRRIIEVLEGAATDDGLRVVVLASSGADFCSGADWVASNAKGGDKPRPGSVQRRTALQAHRLMSLLQEIQLPVVCVVRGWAAGLGCQLALAADFAIAAEDSSFWLPFTKRGFTPDSGATWLLPRLVGIARAKEMLLLGRPVTGRDAAAWGLVHRAVPDTELEEAAAALVEELRSSATVALGLTKRGIHTALDGSLADAMEAEAMALELSSRTADFREGLTAFTERREPNFEGR